MIANRTDQDQHFYTHLQAPPGWDALFPQKTPLYIPANEQIVQVLALLIPPGTYQGEYPIHYFVQGVEDTSLISGANLTAQVMQVRDIQSRILNYPKHLFNGDPYSVHLTVKNNGNVVETIAIKTKDHAFSHVHDCLTLNPQEERDVFLNLQAPCDLNYTSHSVKVMCESLDCENYSEHYCFTHLYPRVVRAFNPYHTLPSLLSFGAGVGGGKFQTYLEGKGDGYLDEGCVRHLVYYARVPLYQRRDVYRDLAGIPENAFLSYRDPNKELVVGQTMYTLTPLTMRYFFGVGSSLRLYSERFQCGALFAKGTNHTKQVNWGGYTAYQPSPWWTCSLQTLSATNRKKHHHRHRKNALINSLSTEMVFLNGTIFGEVGTNWKRGGHGHYINTEGVLYNALSYCVEKGYGSPKFDGHYNDQDNLYATTVFPLRCGYRGSFSFLNFKNNLNRSPHKKHASRDRTYYASLIFPPRVWFTNLTYRMHRQKDVLNNYEDKVHTVRIGGVGYLRQCHYFLGAEVGKYAENKHHHHRLWQHYDASLTCDLFRSFCTTLSASIGNESDLSHSRWRRMLGLCIKLKTLPHIRFQTTYHHYWQRHRGYQNNAYLRFGYLFRNCHLFEFDSAYRRRNKKNEFLCLFQYSIPWNLPTSRKRTIACLSGSLCSESGTPYPYQQVYCGSQKTITDKDGNFCFSNISPGEHDICVNPDAPDFVLCNKEDLHAKVSGGYEKKVSLVMAKSSTFCGRVFLYAFEGEDALAARGIARAGTTLYPTKKIKSLEGVAVYLHSEKRNETYRQLTNSEGEFVFHTLAPGDWKVIVEWSDLPKYHEIEPQEKEIVLRANETTKLAINVVPKQRTIKLLH